MRNYGIRLEVFQYPEEGQGYYEVPVYKDVLELTDKTVTIYEMLQGQATEADAAIVDHEERLDGCQHQSLEADEEGVTCLDCHRDVSQLLTGPEVFEHNYAQ